MKQKKNMKESWKGKQVSFTRKWRTHRFTDDECARLCNGEKIQVELMSKNNTPYKIEGELQEQSFTNDSGKKINFVGFKDLGFVQNDLVPVSWCNHRFTEDERILLEGGKEVYIEVSFQRQAILLMLPFLTVLIQKQGEKELYLSFRLILEKSR